MWDKTQNKSVWGGKWLSKERKNTQMWGVREGADGERGWGEGRMEGEEEVSLSRWPGFSEVTTQTDWGRTTNKPKSLRITTESPVKNKIHPHVRSGNSQQRCRSHIRGHHGRVASAALITCVDRHVPFYHQNRSHSVCLFVCFRLLRTVLTPLLSHLTPNGPQVSYMHECGHASPFALLQIKVSAAIWGRDCTAAYHQGAPGLLSSMFKDN